MFGTYHKSKLSPIDELQLALSEQYITPNVALFEKEFYALRQVLDELWLQGSSALLDEKRRVFLLQKISIEKKNLKVLNPSYPIGRCYNITQIVFAFLLEFELNNNDSMFAPLKKFIEQKGVFKIIWGEVRHEVFQTSMQIGNWYFDVANDTVISTKPKVLKFTFNSAQNEFHEVNTIEQYVAVKRGYHQCEIYLNTVFPALAPLFPLLTKNNDGKYELINSTYVADLMIINNFDFLLNNTLPRLQIETENTLKTLVNAQLSPIQLKRWLFAESKQQNNFSKSELQEALKAVNFINFIFKTSKY